MRVQKVRIRTERLPGRQRVKGQETSVFAVDENGNEHFLENVVSASWNVQSRTGYCEATLKLHNAEVDIEGVL